MLKKIYFNTIIALFSAVLSVQAEDNLKAFPPAEAGMVRHVLHLPQQKDELECKVELIAGKMVKVDKVNRYFFGGKIESETIKGWGYTRYIVPKLGPMAGTLIAIDPNEPKESRFIRLGTEFYLVRYNSRLPIVIYVPEGVEVRYRIWKAVTKDEPVPEG